jgi:uncharacterized protein YcbX
VDAVVSALRIYPVKSCRGIALQTSRVEARGLCSDRRWMIVDERGEFVTQRTAPRLALVSVALEDGVSPVVLRAPGLPELRLAPASPEAPRRRVQVWRDAVDAADCGLEAASWISAWLGFAASIVYMPDDTRRPVKRAYAQPADIVGFADGFPILLANAASLDDLNDRMEEPLPMDRFRPNLVVRGCAPWAEDGWRLIRVRELTIRIVKPCDRCVITTTDQETGERGVEPLRTLARFRRRENDVLFAQNAIPDGPGLVTVGDPVTVLERA